nr:MAG TPA: hypothetical protein [Caudoviricetes sp.]
MVLKNLTQKKGVCTSAIDSFLQMVNLERYGRSFFVRFFCVFLAEEPYFFMPKYKHRRDAECYLRMKFLKKS